MRFYYIIFLTFLSITFSVSAQEFEWNANFHGFADNREYAKSNRYSQTIFGARFAPQIGLRLDTIHRIRVGFNALHEFGSRKFIDNSSPVLYYQMEYKNVDFYIGMFPRQQLLTDYPRAILNDTLQYYRPNVEGMLFKYENPKFRETVWIDWTSRQTATDRETFLFGVSGKYKPGILFVSHHAMMFHNAGPAVKIPGDHVQDNGAASIHLGIDLSRKSFLDSLTIEIGPMLSFERTRDIGGWTVPKGFIMELHGGYKSFAIINTFYTGDGHRLIYGDKFYTTKNYNRSDFSWTPIKYKGIEGRFVLSFHFLEGVVDNQQSFNLRYTIGGERSLKKN